MGREIAGFCRRGAVYRPNRGTPLIPQFCAGRCTARGTEVVPNSLFAWEAFLFLLVNKHRDHRRSSIGGLPTLDEIQSSGEGRTPTKSPFGVCRLRRSCDEGGQAHP